MEFKVQPVCESKFSRFDSLCDQRIAVSIFVRQGGRRLSLLGGFPGEGWRKLPEHESAEKPIYADAEDSI
jgi:hypothetical protein